MTNGTATPTETKSDLFPLLGELADLVPEMRAGQLIAAVGEL